MLPAISLTPTSRVIDPLFRALGSWIEKFPEASAVVEARAVEERTPPTTW